MGVRKRRKPRKGEFVCRCAAYRFPHRCMGGKCDGGTLVAKTFEQQQWGDCRDCPMYEQRECDIVCTVLDGRETVWQCPVLVDFIRFEGIKLYGENKPPEKMGLRFRR